MGRTLDRLGYMRTVSRGSPVDPHWWLPAMIMSRIREGMAPEDSPLTLEDVMSRADYREIATAKVAEGDLAPNFELPQIDGGAPVRLSSLVAERPVALIFGSYT